MRISNGSFYKVVTRACGCYPVDITALVTTCPVPPSLTNRPSTPSQRSQTEARPNLSFLERHETGLESMHCYEGKGYLIDFCEFDNTIPRSCGNILIASARGRYARPVSPQNELANPIGFRTARPAAALLWPMNARVYFSLDVKSALQDC